MLYHIFSPLKETLIGANVFQYITFRSAGAMMTALLVSFCLAPPVIRWLAARQRNGQPIRADGPDTHLLTKMGTPTMGGLLLLAALMFSTLLWANLTNAYIWCALAATAGFGALGFTDDYRKLTSGTSRGLTGRMRLGLGALLALALVWYMNDLFAPALTSKLALPFVKSWMIDLGAPLFLLLGVLVVVGSANGVNLTDGLDGLAIGPAMIAAASFGIIAYLVGHRAFADYLQIHYVAGTGELAVFAAALIGAGLGFLWFNAPPAMVFMGDTGALALGAALGTMAIATKHELVLAIIGGLFVLETLSVIVQVVSFKLTGRRVFAMAPLHHHFEQRGWAEPTIVIRFWIIAVVLALIGLATLKLR